ncbi:hypothetical protein ACWEJZ_31770 [Streptomyces bacillaris]
MGGGGPGLQDNRNEPALGEVGGGETDLARSDLDNRQICDIEAADRVELAWAVTSW